DRGLGVPTALWAASTGVERVHGTGLAVGERVGNACLELLVDNLGLLGARPRPPQDRLIEYCELAARALSWTIPDDHPIAGARFRREACARAYRLVPPTNGARAHENGSVRGVGITDEPLVPMTLEVNGTRRKLAVLPRRTLLEALR